VGSLQNKILFHGISEPTIKNIIFCQEISSWGKMAARQAVKPSPYAAK
jgi:hypothetical protein